MAARRVNSGPKSCERCGTPFSRRDECDGYQWRMKRFCSHACRGAARAATVPPPNPTGLCMCGCGSGVPVARSTSIADGIVRGQPVRYLPGHGGRAAARRGGGNGRHGFGRYVSSTTGYAFIRMSALSPEDADLARPMQVRYAGFPAVPEHRLVVARRLGRPLTQSENVHHRNGQRADNRDANLELWQRSQPSGVRAREVCQHCGGTGLEP